MGRSTIAILKHVFVFCLVIGMCHLSPWRLSGCPYCQMGADPEASRFMLENQKGAFPVDSPVSQYADTSASLDLKVPPPARSIVTTASELPTARPVNRVKPPVAAPPDMPTVANAAAPDQMKSARLADAGLLGLLGLMGFFGWHTRRRPSS